ncbi:MAG: hypothetical protein NVS3B21_08640 [Acidimicrobiales bacterium]
MAKSVRAQLALLALLGVFLIPIATSSLNGLTHVLTCQQRTRAPFTLDFTDPSAPTVLSATSVRRGEQTELCAGLTLDIGVKRASAGSARIVLPITNHTRYAWRGSVKLLVGHTSVPVNVGEVRAGATRIGQVDVRIDPGVHEVGGSLLIGP